MTHHPLFTIGHSNRTIDEFIALLAARQISAVADVRSKPYSRRFPHFDTGPLRAELKKADIAYVFLGDELGARRTEPECYIGGQAQYELIAKTDAFHTGLERVRAGLRSRSIALMCAEKDPLTCHRAILVCRHLRDDCDINHVIDADCIETQHQIEARLLKLAGLPPGDLFRNVDEVLTEAYEIQAKRIAFKVAPAASSGTVQDE
jgi:uncharacterized protein (DUF488 family)